MSKPTAGKTYIVQPGDTLSSIAARAYGVPAERTRIINANDIADPEKIVVGQQLIIPEIPQIASLRRQASVKEPGFRLKIGNRILPVQAGSVTRTMDTPADGWNARIAWTPGLDKDLDELTKPFAFPEASVYLDGELKVGGRLYNVKNSSSNQGTTKELQGFSYTIDIVDSTIYPPFQFQGNTLKDFCDEMAKFAKFQVEIDPGTDVGGQFKEEKIGNTEKIYKFLMRLADKRSTLLSSTPAGDLLLTTANLKSTPVGTIEEGEPGTETWEIDFKGREVFRFHRGILTKKAKAAGKTAILKDENFELSRITTFEFGEGDEKDLQASVAWERNYSLVKALTITIPVDTWYAANGEQWRENTLVSVKSETLQVPNGYTFMIRQVDFFEDAKGQYAKLGLIPPEFYSKKEPVLPWLEKSFSISIEDLKTEQ